MSNDRKFDPSALRSVIGATSGLFGSKQGGTGGAAGISRQGGRASFFGGGTTSAAPTAGADLIPSLSLPKGGGALKNIGDKFAANAFTGSGGMSIPLPLSPGRELTPSLGLSYSTGAGNGPFGVGWQLSVASITRKTDRGLPTYDDASEADTFIFAGAEDLVPLLEDNGGTWTAKIVESGGYRVFSYRPRVEAGFARIERWLEVATGDVHWRTWTRENVRSTYGTSTSSRIAHPEHPERIFSWLVDETARGRSRRGGAAKSGGALLRPLRDERDPSARQRRPR